MNIRPAEHLIHGMDGPTAIVPGPVCVILDKLLRMEKVRTLVACIEDPQFHHTMTAVRIVRLQYEKSATGTGSAPQPEPVPQSKQQLNSTVSTTAAAELLNMTDRAVRKAIAEKRLKATTLDGRYRITHDDLAAYAAQRQEIRHD